MHNYYKKFTFYNDSFKERSKKFNFLELFLTIMDLKG